MHIYDFIFDDHQYELKKLALPGNRPLPFEYYLKSYQNKFLEAFSSLDNKVGSKFLNPALEEIDGVNDWLDDLLKLLQGDIKQIEDLFKELLDVYNTYLKGRHQTAVTYLYALLEKYDMLDEAYSDVLGAFIRGRGIRKGHNFLHESYFYHINFHQRFLISNQRFSVGGHPLLYAGQSMLAVFYELNASSLNDESIATALFAFDNFAKLEFTDGWMHVNPRDKVYDLSNSIYEIVNDTFFKLIELKIPIPRIDGGPAFPKERIISGFRKFILSHLCTFPKTPKFVYNPASDDVEEFKSPYFVEEYVLPQLLTEAIRMHKYNGIIYPSTKFVDKNVRIKTDWRSNFYRNNLAMFTEFKYDQAGNTPGVDEELYRVVKVDVIDFEKIGADYEFAAKVSSIKKFDAFHHSNLLNAEVSVDINFIKSDIPVSEVSSSILYSMYHLEKKLKVYQNMVVDSERYLDTLAGKMELFYLIKYYQFINSQLKRFYRKEWDAFVERQRNKPRS